MKKGRFIFIAAVALALCVMFGAALGVFWNPMSGQIYDLSMQYWEGEAVPEDWVYDQKGWAVFTQEGDKRRELEPNGWGGFSALEYPGQTVYFSRTMVEDLESPSLRLDGGNRTFSVFLDDALIYTDCPELDNRIGFLRLPVLDYYRDDVLLTLPQDYVGKTLTIAQSGESEIEGGAVYPCIVTLSCGYADESRLIAESFQTAVPASLAFAAGAALLAMALWRAARGKLDVTLLCGALTAFLYEGSQISGPSFFLQYFGPSGVNYLPTLCRNLSLLNLLCLLAYKLTSWRRVPLWAVAAGMGASTLTEFALIYMEKYVPFLDAAFFLFAIAGLLWALACGFWEWRESRFFRIFCPLAVGGTALLGTSSLVSAIASGNLDTGPILQLELGSVGYFLWPLVPVFIASAFLAAAVELVSEELAARTEAKLLAQQGKMSRQSYEAMRRQNQEVMMLRHDMAKHYKVLRQMTEDPQVAGYLDELIGENEKIRPVIQSGNETLDIILNSKLGEAAGHGIVVETIRARAPESLPLSDAELCSLVMNIMDNAIEAASAPGVERRYIKLDLHVENSFFVFTCENSSTLEWAQKESAPGHGLGRSVIRRIAERYGNLLNTEYGDGYYKVSVLLPLHRPLK